MNPFTRAPASRQLELVTWIDLLSEDLGPGEVRFQLNFSLPEVRKTVRAAMAGCDKRFRHALDKIQEHYGSGSALGVRVWRFFCSLFMRLYCRQVYSAMADRLRSVPGTHPPPRRLEEQLRDCYSGEQLIPAPPEVELVLQAVLAKASK